MASAAVLAIIVMLACTRWGVATSSDSARYVRTARHILGTEPVVESHESKHEQAHYPPVYPMALAAAGWVTRQDPLAAARVLHAAIFAANALLVAMLVRRAGAGGWAAVLAAAIVVVSPVTITTHAWLLSEALFITLALLTILLICMHLDRPRTGVLIAAALATSLGMLTRYAGAALGPAVVLAILLNDRAQCRTTPSAERSEAPDSPHLEERSIAHVDSSINQRGQRRWIDAAIFSAAALALPVAWFARNLSLGGSATNRTLAFHPISLEHLKDGIAAVATWLWPLGVNDARLNANTHPLLAGGAVLVFVAVLAAGCVLAWRARRDAVGRLAGVLILFLACFIGLLVFSISFVDFHTPMDTRVLSPVFVAWVVLAACVVSHWLGGVKTRPRVIAGVASAALLAVIAWPSVKPPIQGRSAGGLIARLWREGDGFAHPMWRNSPTIAAVRQLRPELQIFTNAPGAIYLLTGRQFLLTIPAEISASSRLANPEYPVLMARIGEELRGGRGVVVYLRRYGARRAYYPSEEQVRRKLGLRVVSRHGDGTIFDVAPGTRVVPVAPPLAEGDSRGDHPEDNPPQAAGLHEEDRGNARE